MFQSALDAQGASPYGQTGWQLLTVKTPAMTLHTFARNDDPPLLFGYKGDIADPAIALALSALNAVPNADRRAESCLQLKTFGSFDYCGFVAGPNRRLFRGVLDDDRIVQVFPMYACELPEQGGIPIMDYFRRWTDIFDMRRAPQPWFQFRMKGKPSGLAVKSWGMERMSTFEGFVNILSEDDQARLEVRNRLGSVLTLSDSSDWNQALLKVRAHLGITPA